MTGLQPIAVASLQEKLGYGFANADLLARALTHRSAGKAHNERLEFLGDAIIGFVVAEAFFHRFPEFDEGTLSRMRASVVSGEALSRVARELGLAEHIILGESERKSGGRHRQSILAGTLEALAGAVVLDDGTERAGTIVGNWLLPSIEAVSPNDVVDAKTQLQEWLQAKKEALPEYTITAVSGSDHAQSFQVECCLPSRKMSTEAVGSSRRRAEQSAASLMLAKLVHHDPS
ncbi:ribonuclease III [Luminiphilus sp.]|nr:ribonuclease III [Luminiphilus sp.]